MSHSDANGHSGSHPGNRTYVLVALVLAVITGVEVMVFYLEALRPVIVPILLVLSTSKFILVASFFMHLKYDSRVLRWLFAGPLLMAIVIIVAIMALYGVFTAGAA